LPVELDEINGARARGRPVRANAGQTKDIDDGDDDARRLERGGRMNMIQVELEKHWAKGRK
jgi:hypothetical protein